MKIVIVCGSHFGQTALIGERIATRIREAHHVVDVYNAREAIPQSVLDRADGIIVGASVEGGKHRPEAVAFVRSHRELLDAKTSAFFSVCMAKASDTADAKKKVGDYVQRFKKDTAWEPEHLEVFAGALMYRKYNFILRLVMRLIAGRSGFRGDTSKNYEMTDWSAVSAFADAFLKRLVMLDPPVALTPETSRPPLEMRDR